MIGAGRPAIRALLVAAVFALASLYAGCEEGRAPYPVIDPGGSATDFLPPDGVRPGTVRTDGLIYRYDRTRYRVFAPIPGTDPRFVRRDSVLALSSAGLPGAPPNLLLRPDLSDPTLAAVYADPRLFGFESSAPANVGFVPGRRTSSAAEFYPVQLGNRWDMNHNGREWAAVDSIVGTVEPPPAAGGMSATRVVTTCRARPDLRDAYQPAVFDQFVDFSVTAGGIYFYAWELTSERVVPRSRRPPGSLIDRQRNPRFLWLPVGQSNDPTGMNQVSVDHCVDELPSFLELVPLKLTDDEIQEGAIYTTWTYITIADQVLRQRLNSEGQLPGGGRCGLEFVSGTDTLRLFPTRSFRMLTRFDVYVERVVDQVTVMAGDVVLGRYPRTATPESIVKFRIVMTTSGGFGETPAQLIDLYLQRGIGPVIRESGVFARTRSAARLRSAGVNGVIYPPDASNPAFEYNDE